MREPNTPIGTCPCPTKGCELDAKVYRYRQRNESPGRARHAGKLYVVCADHGRLDPQEYILANAKIDRLAAESPAATTDESQNVTSASAPSSSSPADKPAASPPARAPKAPASTSQIPPAIRSDSPAKGGFGFFHE